MSNEGIWEPCGAQEAIAFLELEQARSQFDTALKAVEAALRKAGVSTSRSWELVSELEPLANAIVIAEQNAAAARLHQLMPDRPYDVALGVLPEDPACLLAGEGGA